MAKKTRGKDGRWRDERGHYTKAPSREAPYYQDRTGRWRKYGESGWHKPPRVSVARDTQRLAAQMGESRTVAWSRERHAGLDVYTMQTDEDEALDLEELAGELQAWDDATAVGVDKQEDVMISALFEDTRTGRTVFVNLSSAESGEVARGQAAGRAQEWIAKYGKATFRVRALHVAVMR